MKFEEMKQIALNLRDEYKKIEEKNGTAWTARERMEGFVGDVGDLMKLVMAKYSLRKIEGDVDDKLAHELSDCLWSLIVLSDELNVDLEKNYSEKMNKLKKRIKEDFS